MFGFLPMPANSPVEMEPMPDFMVKETEKMPASKRSATEREHFDRERRRVLGIIAARGQRAVANWPFAYSGEATNMLDIHTGQILWVSELKEDDEWVEVYDDASGASGYVPTSYIRLEKDDESQMELMRAWYKFADDCGMASEYLPLIAFLPEELRSVPVDVDKLFEFSRMTEDRLISQIDWI
jgi:hypothetical protein